MVTRLDRLARSTSELLRIGERLIEKAQEYSHWMSLDQQELASELVKAGKSISAVARTFNVHSATIYRVIEAERPYATFQFLLGPQAHHS